MATRRKGQLDMDLTVETLRALPLDARQLVRTKEELLDPDSFQYGYNGMIVACRDERKVYMLIDSKNPGQEASWQEVGGEEPQDIQPISAAEIAAIVGG